MLREYFEDQSKSSLEPSFQDIEVALSTMERNYNELLQRLGMSAEDISHELQNTSTLLTEEEQEEINAQKKKFESEQELISSSFLNPKELQKKYAEKKEIKNNWLFVR